MAATWIGVGFIGVNMAKGKLSSRVHFHDWEAVLQHGDLPTHRKEGWAITIRWYLSWTKRARVPVDFDSARDFMAQMEMEKHPSVHRLEQWKDALRWFFREGKRRAGGQNASHCSKPAVAGDCRSQGSATGEGGVDRSAARAMNWRQESIRVLRVRKYTYRTEQTYLEWLTRYEKSLQGRDLIQCGAEEVRAFLDDLAVRGRVSASTQRQALNALVFLYREVLDRDLGDFSDYRRARARTNMRTSMTRSECDRFLAEVEPSMKLLVGVLYGSGVRLMEGLRLRVKDLDLERRTLTVRRGKGGKDRVTVVAGTSELLTFNVER